MYTLRSVSLLVTSLAGILAAAFPLEAQLNSWIKPTSGDWQELSWSLGVRPASTQTVAITNAGWKSVAIGPNTWRQYPESLSVSNLYIDAPTNSLNTLLLNYAYTEVPLRVSDRLEIGTNGILRNLYSSLVVTNKGRLIINGGKLIQEGGFAKIQNGLFDGEFTSTNATLNFGKVQAGVFSPTVVNQTGGTNTFDSLTLSDFWSTNSTGPYQGGAIASFNLANGVVVGNNMSLGRVKEARWNQDGGLVQIGSLIAGDGFNHLFKGVGTYRLRSGALQCGYLDLGYAGAVGIFIQEGGTNSVAYLHTGLGDIFDFSHGSYYLSNGILYTGSVLLGNGGSSRFTQAGGTHYVTNELVIRGGAGPTSRYHNFSVYNLDSGQLEAGELYMGASGNYMQNSGTARIRGRLTIDGFPDRDLVTTYLVMSNGMMSCSDFLATNCDVSIYGGKLVVTNTLSIGGNSWWCPCPQTVTYSDFLFRGDTLTAGNIEIYSRVTLAGSRQWSVTNSGYLRLADASYLIIDGSAQERLGYLIVDGAATLSLGNSHVQFANSAHANWKPGALLTITGWNGSTSGGGATRISFGTNNTALTQSQLAQIQFDSPSGFPKGAYNATILQNGEVVPSTAVTLQIITSPTNIVISWKGLGILQSATNVEGPFEDMLNAASPHSIQPGSLPKQFFRLKR